MNRLSVAVLLSGREQFSVYYGGALARWTYEVYSRLQNDIDAEVFGFPTDRKTSYPLVHHVNGSWRLCALLSQVPVLRRYEDLIWLRSLMPSLRRFEAIHIHNRPQWAQLLRSLGYGGFIVVHLQNDHLGHWTAPMLDALASRLDGLVVCSNYLRSQSSGKSEALAAKTSVVFNGVDTASFSPRPEIREPKTIFFVGRFDPQKGPLQLVQAYAGVLRTHPDAKLIIGGSTNFGKHEKTGYVKEVFRLAGSLQKQYGASVEFTGYIHHDRDLPAFFRRATLFTSPSLFQEPFGLVNAEAMACATPVVGSNRGGIPEVIGDTGLLIDPENVPRYTDALSQLLSDPQAQARFGKAALERSRKLFDWGIIASKWASYLNVITKRRSQAVECA